MKRTPETSPPTLEPFPRAVFLPPTDREFTAFSSVPFTMRREGVIRLVVRFGNTFSRPAA